MGMQEQVTAKREQVDSLRGRIQLLEETLEKLSDVKPQHLLLPLKDPVRDVFALTS